MRAASGSQLTLLLFALLLPGARPVFAAGQHVFVVTVSNGQAVYKQAVAISEGAQFSQVSPTKDKWMIINALLNRDSGAEGQLSLQYQLELSGGPRSQGRSIQVQSEAALRPGARLAAVECGPWTVTLELDPVKTGGKKSGGTSWNTGGLPNYRLTTNVSSGNSKQLCRLVSRAGVQSNVVDSITKGDRKYGFIINSLFTPGDDGRGFLLQYQLEHGLNGAAGPLQIQNEQTLTLNRKTKIPGEGYKLEFLLEGKAPAKQASPENGVKSGPGNEYGTVPLLH